MFNTIDTKIDKLISKIIKTTSKFRTKENLSIDDFINQYIDDKLHNTSDLRLYMYSLSSQELDDLVKSVETLVKNKKSVKLDYNNTIYSLDIETSTIYKDKHKELWIKLIQKNDDTKTNAYSFMYMYAVSSCDFKQQLKNNIADNVNLVEFGRTYAELDLFLIKLMQQSMKKHETTIVYIHNLSYEFSFFLKNLKIFSQFDCSIMCDSVSKIFACRLGKLNDKNKLNCFLELRCSYRFTGFSISTLGDMFNFPKLDYDYSIIRTPVEQLTKHDYDYNLVDTIIALLGVVNTCKKYLYISSVSDIPYTKTSLTRIQNKQINDKKIIDRWCFRCFDTTAKNIDDMRLQRDAYNGGFCCANPYYVGQIFSNVASIDLVSSYPSAMTNFYYPNKILGRYASSEANGKFLEWYKQNVNRNLDNVISDSYTLDKFISTNYTYNDNFAGRLGYIFKLEITELSVKQFPHNNIFPILNISTIIDKSNIDNINNKCNDNTLPRVSLHDKDSIIYNGKLIKSKAVITTKTDAELMLILNCYNFKTIKCVECLEYTMSKPSPYTVNCVLYYLKLKTIYKKLWKISNKRVVNADDINTIDTQHTIDDVIRHDILSASNNRVVQHDKIDMYLMTAKADLNAQYGINVENFIHDEYILNTNLDYNQIEKNETNFTAYFEKLAKQQHNIMHSYLIGEYITAYSKIPLVSMFLRVAKSGYNFKWLYCDTDSLKIQFNKSDTDNFKKLLEDFNAEWLDRHHKYFRTIDKEFRLGCFDLEYTYINFVTLGAKRYLSSKPDNDGVIDITATISGLPEASNKYRLLYKNFSDSSFKELAEQFFKVNTVFTNSKTTTNHTSQKHNLEGIYGVSGVILELQDVTLNGIDRDIALFDTTTKNTALIRDISTLTYYFRNTSNLLHDLTKYVVADDVSKVDIIKVEEPAAETYKPRPKIKRPV